MFRDLRTRVTQGRRVLAWVLFAVLAGAAGYFLFRERAYPALHRTSLVLMMVAGTLLAIRLLSFFVLDPLLRERRTATPGFARDLLVVALYALATWFILRNLMGVSVQQLLGTGAIAAAVIGLSLQETLGSLFAGIAMRLDPVFEVGDWIEVTGNLRGGNGRDTFIGEVTLMTWRTVQLRTENGDTDIFPNRLIAQAVVTNLYAPSGLHRRTAHVTVAPHPDLHVAVSRLTIALAGIPHYTHHRPEVVVWGSEQGGAVLEMRWWALGFRHGRAGNFLAQRLANTVLPREGFPLLGPHGATSEPVPPPSMDQSAIEALLLKLNLPVAWAEQLQGHVNLRAIAPDEGLIREGDPGESLFYVLEGRFHVVRPVERIDPYTGLYWDSLGELGPGDWFGEASLLTGAPRSATVVAGSPCRVVEIPKIAFESCLRQDPRIIERLVDLMEARVKSRGIAETAPHAERRAQWISQIRTWFGV
ncbi:MAG: mechanosensitive ion channel family protein [Firmicutes bacterium]|nr:mechanosensitive ion channel family protein [Bacillota bacterium]